MGHQRHKNSKNSTTTFYVRSLWVAPAHRVPTNLELSKRSGVGITMKAEKDVNAVNKVGQHLLEEANTQLKQVHDPDDSHVL